MTLRHPDFGGWTAKELGTGGLWRVGLVLRGIITVGNARRGKTGENE
jgi:hypothetical protein